jgi:hypothetical protein
LYYDITTLPVCQEKFNKKNLISVFSPTLRHSSAAMCLPKALFTPPFIAVGQAWKEIALCAISFGFLREARRPRRADYAVI